MKRLALALSLAALPAAADTRSGGNRPGEFKGYMAINDAVKARLLDPSGGTAVRYFQIGRYFAEAYPEDGGLWTLLGAFQGFGPGAEFKPGAPNSLNMLLWYMAASGLGADLGTVCARDDRVLPVTYAKLSQDAFNRLRAACDLSDDAAERRATLLRVWLAVVGYDAPRAEFEAWATHFGEDPEIKALDPGARIAAMVTAMLLNPYFLLES